MIWIKENYITLTLSFLILLVGIFHLGLPIYVDLLASLVLAVFLNSWLASIYTTVVLLTGFVIINIFILTHMSVQLE